MKDFFIANYKLLLFLLILAIWSASTVYFFRAKLWRKKGDRMEFSRTSGQGSVSQAGTQKMNGDVVEIKGEDISLGPDWLADINNNSNFNNNTMHAQTNTFAEKTTDAGQASTVFSPRVGQDRSSIVDVIAAEAEQHRVVISEEGMNLIAEKGKHDATATLNLVDSIIKNAEQKYTRDDGWLLLNKEKITSVLGMSLAKESPTVGFAQLKKETSIPQKTSPAPIPPIAPVSAQPMSSARPASHAEAKVTVDSSLFVSWIATGDKQRPVQHIKTLRDLGTAESFLKRVVLDLDVVYRARFDEIDEMIDERLMHTISGLSNEQLEQLISVLLSTVDQSYHSPLVGIKIALLRASEVGKRR